MAKISLKNISKQYKGGQIKALRNLSLEVADGEFFCILGPAGAGKTTTIKLIAGNEAVDGGSIYIGDQDVTDLEAKDRDVAVAYETYALYPHRTVRENLSFPLEAPIRKKDYTTETRNARVIEIAEMLGIGELLDRFPRQLSGGQRQRVALGRALVRKPKAYLLDEPIAHLDAKLRHRMRGELKRIQMEFGITTVYTTPDQLEALSLPDHLAVLNAGVIEQVGTPDEVYRRPANIFVARLVGDPPMNMLESELKGDQLVIGGLFRIQVPDETKNLLADKSNGKDIMLGVRPKNLIFTSLDSNECLFRAIVEHVQVMGETSIVTLNTNNPIDLRAKVSTQGAPKPGENVGLVFDLNDCHFFDNQTEHRISRP
jgi:multiple sugar transport system ATP-binding protein